MAEPSPDTLAATDTIESKHPRIVQLAQELCQDGSNDSEKAISLFNFVRDQIPYSVFMISMLREEFAASFTLEAGKGYCVQKAVLLCALARAANIPTRLAIAKIHNHRVPAKLFQRLQSRVFPAHGYNQFWLDGHWVNAAATFDRGLCAKVGVAPVDFDGHSDALLPQQALDGGPYIEYLEHYGPELDLPHAWIIARTAKIWGPDKRAWRSPADEK